MGMFGDIFGPLVSAYSNHREAEMDRDWQESQRATAYQTTVADLTAAGLSPMLAYSKGPTGGGSGATAAPMQPIKLGETEQREAEIDVSNEQAKVLRSTQEVNTASAEKLRAETRNIDQDTENKRLYPGMNEAQIKELLERAGQHGASSRQLDALMDSIRQQINLHKPAEEFKKENPNFAKYMSPIQESLRTIFEGLGLLRGSSAMPFVTKNAPRGK